MRAAVCPLFVTLALPLALTPPATVVLWAQALQMRPEPRWLTELQQIQQEVRQAPLGALDQRVEQAWRAALQTPQHPHFAMAVQMTTSYFQSQGYDLRAEQILRQSLAAVPEADVQARRGLTSQLASHFESIQQLNKALAIREQMAKEPLPPEIAGHNAAGYESAELARLYERMGEFEKAEAAWKEVAARRQLPPSGSGVVATLMVGSFSISGSQTELAGFYLRRGRTDDAEQLYKKELADADQRGSWQAWNGAADAYIAFLRQQNRLNEATDLLRQSIARIESLPHEIATHVLHAKLQHLAGLYTEAGRFDDAVAVHRQAIEAAHARGSGSLESFQAYTSLAETLLQQNRLEDAERAVDGMRQAALAAANQQYYESMTAQTLARIRDKQNRPEEARELRASVVRIEHTPNPGPTVSQLIGPAQQAAFQGDIDAALAAVERALSLAAERMHTNPEEVSGLISLAQVLMSRQQEEAARRIVVETVQLLRQAPDHPRISDALGSVISALAQMGMTAEAEQAIERQERILVSAKGADSIALNAIGHARIALYQHDSNHRAVLEERKRMLARTEAATGPKSVESFYALREVAWAYPALDNWPEEQQVLATLLERTVHISGPSSLDHAHLLVHMANRASQNRQFEEALAWMDQAIEITRGLPDAAIQLPGMIENRTQIEQAKDPNPARPFHTPFGAAGGIRRWFDAYRFQETDGETPVENLLHRPGRFIPNEPPVEAPAPLPRLASPQR